MDTTYELFWCIVIDIVTPETRTNSKNRMWVALYL
jgi:hypothetical protein